MSQTYSPGTVLSIGFGDTLEQVIVLSDNKVATKLYAGKHVEKRDIMSLADWQTIAASLGQQVTTDYLPVPAAEPAAAAAPVAAPEPVAVPESYPIGTKLTWQRSDNSDRWYNPNTRTAIVLKDGILQVKEVILGIPTMTQAPGADYQRVARKFFSSLADWKMTLPADGIITASVPTDDISLPSIQRKAAKPIVAESDIDYINELQKRYAVCSYLHEGLTPLEQREALIAQMTEMSNEIHGLMRSSAIIGVRSASSSAVSDAMNKLSGLGKRLARRARKVEVWHESICSMPDKANVKPISFINDYRQQIMAFVGGREVEITSCKKRGLLGVAWDREQDAIGKWFKPTVGKTFAELGIDLKADGKPLLKVYYRRDTINI
jgi:hypothetical protein